jgi:hypothetical protein
MIAADSAPGSIDVHTHHRSSSWTQYSPLLDPTKDSKCAYAVAENLLLAALPKASLERIVPSIVTVPSDPRSGLKPREVHLHSRSHSFPQGGAGVP